MIDRQLPATNGLRVNDQVLRSSNSDQAYRDEGMLPAAAITFLAAPSARAGLEPSHPPSSQARRSELQC